jgi:dTDP-4-dehydrorhamnose reductase/UDP-glucose 4-epimerase
MRLLIAGKNSFLARHILAAAQAQGLEPQAVSHDDPGLADALSGVDWVVNCAIHPRHRDRPYQPAHDFDLRLAELARRAGAGFTMLSSRKVYSASLRWNAREDAPAAGDGSFYGDNKARSEAAVRATGVRWTIFRLSNAIGLEQGRATFAGQLLTSLKARGEILFDMNPGTRRDFLPAETAAVAIVRQVRNRLEGVFNLGCGFPLPCGELADWIMQGFGGGRLVVTDDTVRDEFFLNMDKSGGRLGLSSDPGELQRYGVALGLSLRSA